MHHSVYRIRTIPQYYINFSQISSAKSASKFFVKILFATTRFSLKAILQNLSKNNQTKKKTNAVIQATLKYAPAQKLTEEKISLSLSQKIQGQITNYNYLHLNVYSVPFAI